MSSSKLERPCAMPNCKSVGIHLCSGCGEEIYCSKDCQKNHWVQHKVACRSAMKPEAAGILQSFEHLSVKQLQNLLKAKAGTLDQKKKGLILNQLENIKEKPHLLKLVKQYVQPAEIEALLTNNPVAPPPMVAPPSHDPSHGNTNANGGKYKKKLVTKAVGGQPNGNGNLSPDQLRQQADLMRKNPDLVRKSNAHFAKMTNQQIIQYAEQLEKAASDPSMMKEIESMAKLSTSERDQLQNLQEGLSGAKPMDNKWAKATIKTLKTNPNLFKTMLKGKGDAFGGVTDEQIFSFVDTASRMDATTLQYIFYVLKFLGSLVKPLTSIYNTVDTYTLGNAKYIVLAIVGISFYYSLVATWRVLAWLSRGVVYLWGFVRGTSGAASNVSVDLGIAADAVAEAAANTAAAATAAASASASASAATATAGSSGGNAAVGLAEKIAAGAAAAASAAKKGFKEFKSQATSSGNKKGEKSAGDSSNDEFEF